MRDLSECAILAQNYERIIGEEGEYVIIRVGRVVEMINTETEESDLTYTLS